jgi:hypothetical protein
LLTGLKYYCGKKSIIAALLATGNKPRENYILNYLFQADERIRRIQNLYGGYNLENTFVE